MLTGLNVRNEEVLGALEDDIDVDRKVLIGVCQHQKVQKLRVIEEKETVKSQSLLFKVFVCFLLQNKIVLSKPSEYFHALLD